MSESINLEIYEYTPASFLVTGDTKLHKDNLKELKGKFSTNLKNLPGECAWLFSMQRLQSVKHYIKTGEVIVADLPEFKKQVIMLRRLDQD